MAGVLDSAVGRAAGILEEGSAIKNAVTVLIGPLKLVYTGWESIRIQRAIDQLAGSFALSLVDKWKQTFQNWPMVPGLELLVNIGTQPVIRGYIDRINVSVKNDDRTLEITGRDITADLVDSSIPATAPVQYNNLTIKQLADLWVTPFGIPVTFDTDIGLPFPKFTINEGESVFEALNRAAELRGLLIQSTEFGTLNITNRLNPASFFRSPTPLVQGQNVLEASATYDESDRFSQIYVKGQGPGTDLFNRKAVTSVISSAFDPGVTRPFRTKTIIADGSIDFVAATKKANWEANVRAAKSAEIKVKVQGWRMDPLGLGPLWRPNTLVTTNIPYVGQQVGEMLIRAVQLNKSVQEGTTADLSLIRPDAYIPEQPVVNVVNDTSKNLGWKFQVARILK